MTQQYRQPTPADVIKKMQNKAAKEWWSSEDIARLEEPYIFAPGKDILLLLRWKGLIEMRTSPWPVRWRLTVAGLDLPF